MALRESATISRSARCPGLSLVNLRGLCTANVQVLLVLRRFSVGKVSQWFTQGSGIGSTPEVAEDAEVSVANKANKANKT